MWRVTIKGLLDHRMRMLLTALSVVLGVGFVAGTFVVTDTMSGVFDELVGSTGGIDVFVEGEDALDALVGSYYERPLVDPGVLDEVAAVEGVQHAFGGVEGYAQIIAPDGHAIVPVGPPTLGASWIPPPLGSRQVAPGGHPPEGPDEVVVDHRTADRHDLHVGDRVQIVFGTVAPRTFEIVGIASNASGDNLAGATLAEFDLATAQEVLGHGDHFTQIQLSAADGVTPDELAARVDAVLGEGLAAITAAESREVIMEQVDSALGFFTIALGIFGAVALVVGAFIIANTFSIVVVQRTRELALLRALGATDRQVVGSLLLEAVLVGLLASVLGVVAGLGLAALLQALLSLFGFDMPSGALVLRPRTVAVALLVGVGVTLLSALLPARKASRLPPIAALRDVQLPVLRVRPARTAAAAVAAATGIGLVVWALTAHPDRPEAVIGVAALLVLLALGGAAPLLSRPLVRLLAAPAARLGVPGRLARGNALRTPRRTWATASALMIGLALVSLVAVLAASLKASATAALDTALRADLVLTAGGSLAGGSVPTVVAETLAAAPEVGAVSPVRAGFADLAGAGTALVAIDPTTWEDVAAISVTAGALAGLAEQGTVMVDTDVAAEHDLAVDDVVAGEFLATGHRDLTVAAVFEPDQLLSGWVLGTATYDANVAQPLDAAVLVVGDRGVPLERVREAVAAVTAAYPAVQVQDQGEYREATAGQVDQLLALVTALLGMALLISVLGITNTLALSVHERTREIGLLRAVGMTRRQVRAMIRWEAVTVAVLGALLGTAVGIAFAWALVRALADEGLTRLVVPGGQLAVDVAVAALAGMVAAVLPARRAARLDVLDAVTVE